MSASEESFRSRARKAKIAMWIGRRASRNTGAIDRLCRRLLERLTKPGPDGHFMQDDLIDSDRGFDPDELARYERGESI